MLLKHKNYEHHIDFEIKAAKNSTSEKSKKEIDRLPKPRRTFTPQLMWKKLRHRWQNAFIHPWCSIISRQSSVLVSRDCFLRWSSLVYEINFPKFSLDQLIHIATESPKEGFSDETYEELVNNIEKRNPKLRIVI